MRRWVAGRHGRAAIGGEFGGCWGESRKKKKRRGAGSFQQLVLGFLF